MKFLFDLGGVIVDLQRDACLQAFDAIGIDIRPFIGTFRQGGVFSQLEYGEIGISEFCETLRTMSGNAEATDERIVAAWEAYLAGIPEERLELLSNIRRNYPTYLLSNTNAVHWEQTRRDFLSQGGRDVADYFEATFLSYELHLQKPDPAIYRAVIGRVGGAPEEILFLDDSEENCRVARECGLQARLAPAQGVWMKLFDAKGRWLDE